MKINRTAQLCTLSKVFRDDSNMGKHIGINILYS